MAYDNFVIDVDMRNILQISIVPKSIDSNINMFVNTRHLCVQRSALSLCVILLLYKVRNLSLYRSHICVQK